MVQVLLATSFIWTVTALGAATVFMARDISRRVLDTMLGFAGGVMIAASYWSLLAPAIEMSEGKDIPAWVPAVAGFLFGGIFLWGVHQVTHHAGCDLTEAMKQAPHGADMLERFLIVGELLDSE